MTNREAIDIIKNAVAEVEWNYPMEYAAAFEMAIKALEAQDALPSVASVPAVNARFRATTGDIFTVTRVEGPHCVVRQERTGYEYVYGIDALMRLPITWIEVWQE